MASRCYECLDWTIDGTLALNHSLLKGRVIKVRPQIRSKLRQVLRESSTDA